LSEYVPEQTLTVLRLPRATAADTAQSIELVGFKRDELRAIFDIYGRKVAEGIWRDYALDFSTTRAIFSIYRKNGEAAYYRIIKEPRMIRRYGAFSAIAQTGLILKRGSDLAQVLKIFEKKTRLVTL
jgi:hypothetical protein